MTTIRITDGRSHLWRYDTGVQIQLLGCSHATECHFVAPGGVIRREMVDGVCDVPDAALTVAGTLTIYAFERNPDGGTTRHSFMLLVQDRPKPVDYVDPPDEVDNLQALAERVAEVLGPGSGGAAPEQIQQAMKEALEVAKESGVFDGEKGEKGEAGKDGYTPVKGIDYYTDADRAEIVDAVIAALPVYAGEVADL